MVATIKGIKIRLLLKKITAGSGSTVVNIGLQLIRHGMAGNTTTVTVSAAMLQITRYGHRLRIGYLTRKQILQKVN
jgi:hypothetical protein